MQPATARATEGLREAILRGELAPGERLGEVETAARLAVSRTPVREALSRLAAEGLVEQAPGRGARVSSWTPDALREVFALRLLLEPHAVHLAVTRMDAATLGELDRLAEAMLVESDLDALVGLNHCFHDLLVQTAGSAPLATALTSVTHAAVVSRNFHRYRPDALARSLAHHVEIVAAARAGQPEWAAAVMRSHLHNARVTMLDDATPTP